MEAKKTWQCRALSRNILKNRKYFMYYSTFQKGTKVLQEDGQADQAWMDGFGTFQYFQNPAPF